MDLEKLLADRLAPAFAAVAGEPVDPVVRRSQHADFQSDAALALARRLGRPPRAIAADVLARAALPATEVTATVSGPGFINLSVADGQLGALLAAMAGDPRLGVPPNPQPETVVVDYSGPNVAKEMHVGHLRSTIIGDAVARLLGWLGHRVIRANHLGDWGTPFGMLIEHLIDVSEAAAVRELSVGDLNAFYRAARAKFDADATFQDRARSRVVALQSGDERTLALWRLLVAESQRHFLGVYDRLDVELTRADFHGESRYNDQLGSVTDELDRLGLLRDSDGAACVFPAGFTGRDGQPLPLIVRKRDGGYGYAATDLAAVRYRTRELGATRLLYVVGWPQRQHFAMVYAVARQAGWLTEPARTEHIGFGSVLGPDGRMLRSRSGETVRLADLLDEAVRRAAELARERDPGLSGTELDAVARAVGLGALKYADLSSDRGRDYIFDWQRMLSLDGDTAPYLQYAHARIRSIFRRAGAAAAPDAPDAGPSSVGCPGPARDGIKPDRPERVGPGHPTTLPLIAITEPAERALALELLNFATVIATVERNLEFHRLAGYLHTVATTFNVFYERCPVLRAPGPVRASRLALCDLTARILRQGLYLLGITAPDRL